MEPPADLNALSQRVRVSILQTKPLKGKYAENLAAAGEAFAQIAADGTDLVVMPEAALTGYFLEGAVYDLALTSERFAADLARTWRAAAGDAPVSIVCGFFENDGGTYYNSALFLDVRAESETIVHVHRKLFLPTYGVFDEERFLSRGRKMGTFETRFGRAAILICEDVWHSIVPTMAAVKGARVLFVPSAAPGRGVGAQGELESVLRWRDILRTIASEHGVYVVYAGLTGFEGGKGLSGSSTIVGPRGDILAQAPALDACIVDGFIDSREIDLARANLPLLGDLNAVLPDLLLDDELPLPRASFDADGR